MLNKKLIIVFLSFTATSPLVQAVEINKDLNLNLTATAMSEYRRSGFDLSDGKPVVQGLVSLAHKSGWDISAQISNYDVVVVPAKYEIAYTAGYFHAFNEKVYVYSSLGQTIYPNWADGNVTEWFISANAYGAFFNYFYDWGKNSNAQYRYIGYKYNFPNDVWLDMRYGYNDVGIQLKNENGDIRHNYSTRKVELGKKYNDISYTLAYADTDLTNSECTQIMAYGDKCSSTVVFGIKKTF
ncbi:hypothetical protein AWW73_13050 [Acinetobacter lactucae]|uniref:TorF family putative porin n=1 Tax=Acinetobacter lactucae TaxID=1785128 RepID=UPI00079FEA34|nr:TorF family putative porin [Acinetobacter lactucae]KYQ81492.1 hypothetical protein AWW73_13050 [Acinetobacter lactucae]